MIQVVFFILLQIIFFLVFYFLIDRKISIKKYYQSSKKEIDHLIINFNQTAEKHISKLEFLLQSINKQKQYTEEFIKSKKTDISLLVEKFLELSNNFDKELKSTKSFIVNFQSVQKKFKQKMIQNVSENEISNNSEKNPLAKENSQNLQNDSYSKKIETLYYKENKTKNTIAKHLKISKSEVDFVLSQISHEKPNSLSD